MRFNLHLTYWSLLSITFISSCCLFFVVASENAKYVPATTGATLVAPAAAPSDAGAAAQQSLPIYKKVKKPIETPNPIEATFLPAAPTVVPVPPLADEVKSSEQQSIANDNIEPIKLKADAHVPPSSRPPTANKISDALVIPINGENGGVISEVPKAEDEPNVVHKHDVSKGAEKQQVKKHSDAAEPNDKRDESLPDISDIPTVTVIDLPLDMLQAAPTGIDALVIDASHDSGHQPENRTVDILENSNEAMQKDEQIIKINDSGGGERVAVASGAGEIPSKSEENIPVENGASNTTTTPGPQNASSSSSSGDSSGASASTVNLTAAAAEEVPIPVFSEWAQKQMEAAEKQEAMEQEVVNTSAQKKNHTNGGPKKLPPLKIRAKNYASPDCGAKIIASNSDATNTGAVLSSSKDEYMLSPCGNRIWFVVELCEAIQAQKIDLANFELFSSSPKNFTVAVSNRFPTRDWSNVGRFIAEDKRNVQGFELHPHLFGKFVRVDIYSHYSKEHFCPVSLFRVFGTSEFEAFETENQPNDDLDDFDDEFATLEQAHAKNSEPNLFKSASDAVLSIVKKAAEVLVKPSSNQNQSLVGQAQRHVCHTPAFGQFSCAECNRTLVERINNALSCEFSQLTSLLSVPRLRKDLQQTHVCAKRYGIETRVEEEDCNAKPLQNPFEMDVKHSYYINLLPAEYVGALCQLLAAEHPRKSHNDSVPDASEREDAAELALNLTIDKKTKNNNFKIIAPTEKQILKADPAFTMSPDGVETKPKTDAADIQPTTTTERNPTTEDDQMPRPPAAESVPESSATPAPEIPKETAPDVNIFNVSPEDAENPELVESSSTEVPVEGSGDLGAATTTTEANIAATPKSEEDAGAWDSLDNLLVPTAASITTPPTISNGINLQQKIPSGPQSESVFIRLSNRIKALERNMSLSGQYLEELSRRYKKQVEELQQTLTQQTQTVRSLEDHNRRHSELEQLLAQRNSQLKDELDDLSLQVHACIVVIIFVGAFVFLVLMVGILFYRSMRRETKELLSLHTNGGKRNAKTTTVSSNQRKLNRRKSFEDFSDHQQTLSKGGEKQRRPSEEAALLILKECGDIETIVGDTTQSDAVASKRGPQPRQRKVSVYGGSGSNLNSGQQNNNSRANKRKGEKHSWPNTEQAQQQAWQHLEELQADDCDKFVDAETLSRQQSLRDIRLKPKTSHLAINGQHMDHHKSGKLKKKTQNFKRQESAPSEFHSAYEPRLNVTAPGQLNAAGDYEENLILDEDDLDNFIPNADLVYNEFMPDGPSGYQIVGAGSAAAAAAAAKKSEKATTKKTRRLSSPAFFKSPFSKSLKTKASTAATSKANPSHESTSWEWYRSKKSEAQQQKNLRTSISAGAGGFLCRATSPAVSLDSSSLSEINFPTNSTENSFRILEEAILSSGESATTTNGNGGQSASSGGSSNRSSTSTSSSKKKNRSFNKIFRKVF